MEHKSKKELCKELGIPTYETFVTYHDAFGKTMIYYHETPIATIFDSGHLKLDNGGFYIHTTKKRMNSIIRALKLPYTIRQVQFQWELVDDEGFTYPIKRIPTGWGDYHMVLHFDLNTGIVLPKKV